MKRVDMVQNIAAKKPSPSRCADCNTAWLYALRRKRLGLCSKCEEERRFKREILAEARGYYPDLEWYWTLTDTLTVSWDLGDGKHYTGAFTTEELRANKDQLKFFFLLHEKRAIRLAEKAVL